MRYEHYLRRYAWTAIGAALGMLTLMTSAGCQTDKTDVDQPISAYRDRMLVEHQQEIGDRSAEDAPRTRERSEQDRALIQLAGSQSEETKRASLVTEPDVDEVPTPADILAEIPDPSEAEQVFADRLAKVEKTARETRVVNQYKRVVAQARENLKELRQARQVELSLAVCIQRAIANNYTIRRESYGPAISRASLVEAEAAFDAAFFLDFTHRNTDQPTASQLASNQSDFRQYQGGLRKLLPTGMQVQTGVGQSRSFTDLVFATLNPAYDSKFTASFTQPLLRGFGLDYNRAGINIARADVRISREAFIQQVRDTLLSVEQAYWQLVAARRNAMVLAETVGQNWVTYQSMKDRLEHDTTPVEVNNSKSRWQSRRVEYIEAVRQVRDAEDQLRNLMNDPDFKLSDDVEIIPAETLFLTPIALDHFAEARAALEQRSEIRQARLGIEQTRIQTQRAKNETLPQLDLSFQYDVQGIGTNADNSFDNMTTNRFRSYSVSVNFSYPIGNRGPRAALRRARMQESQAVVQLQQVLDLVVTEINAAVRQLNVRYEQIPPQLGAVKAANSNLRAFQARAENVGPNYLETELSAIEQLAGTRQRLLQVITEYNVAIVQLEKAKGTLLDYNNVQVSDESAGR
ncbi:MAG: TolC family protein [Planctomycetes bacterium]|nr:TolC family protein [Planctomycetota bacterium]